MFLAIAVDNLADAESLTAIEKEEEEGEKKSKSPSPAQEEEEEEEEGEEEEHSIGEEESEDGRYSERFLPIIISRRVTGRIKF